MYSVLSHLNPVMWRAFLIMDVKASAFSFSKLKGMDAYLLPEMKSTVEAIGYDKKLHRAAYKAMVASGLTLRNYGTGACASVMAAIAAKHCINLLTIRRTPPHFTVICPKLVMFLCDVPLRAIIRKWVRPLLKTRSSFQAVTAMT